MTARDPGNKPGPGDRIPFVYIHSTNKSALQGEKIETPTFILNNNLIPIPAWIQSSNGKIEVTCGNHVFLSQLLIENVSYPNLLVMVDNFWNFLKINYSKIKIEHASLCHFIWYN